REVEHDLLPDGEQIVQPIDLGPGVREAPTPTHHTMEVVVMLRVKGNEHCDDGVPRANAPGDDPVAADLAAELTVESANPGRLVEDDCVLCEPSNHQIDVHLREFPCHDSIAG